MLLPLPRRGLLGWDEASGQLIEALMRILELSVHEAQAGGELCDVSPGGFDAAEGDLQGRLAQEFEHVCGVEAADASA
jgi:hypothetical protein